MSLKRRPTPPLDQGFTLLEVMIAIVISSIGLLGVAALQLGGLHAVNSTGNRSQANLLADDLIEMMQANPTAVLAGNYTTAPVANNINNNCMESYSGSSNVTAANCTPAQLAAYELSAWFFGFPSGVSRNGGVVNQIPVSPVVAVTCSDVTTETPTNIPCSDGSPHTVCISWQEQGVVGSASATDCSGAAVTAGSTQTIRYTVRF
ncbi:MAG: type IV pilus modification protein PilV [Gammaproteobacteria bacterium]|nr:type IV pilus modification protein PilV [Gammaproteobacteria bacterium]